MSKKYQILVADDEPAVREVLCDLILALGQEYAVYSAADSYEALEMIQSLTLDLILVDIFMPGLNGLELVREIRRTNPNLMIVVITGQPSYDMVLEALRQGATDFLAKPISLAELRKILFKLKNKQEEAAAAAPESASGGNKAGEQLSGGLPEAQFLRTMSEKLSEVSNFRELYLFLTDMALAVSGGMEAKFFLYDPERGRLQLVSHSGTAITPAGPGEPESVSGKDSGHGLLDQKPAAGCFRLPLKLRGELLGMLQVCYPANLCFAPEVVHQLQLLADRFVLTMENLTLQESVSANLYDTLRALINSLEARDPSTRHHSVRVTSIAARFAEKIGLSPELVDSLRRAGALHDIGKIGIPDAVLLKPAALTPEEMEIIRQHPVIGDNIVAPLRFHPRERAIILHHHERWDGKGYPMGLKGHAIPLLSRIIALADAYDAIISERPYRSRRSHDEALVEIAAHAGTQFDPELAQQFIEVMSRPLMREELHHIEQEIQKAQPPMTERQFQRFLSQIHAKGLVRQTRKKDAPVTHN